MTNTIIGCIDGGLFCIGIPVLFSALGGMIGVKKLIKKCGCGNKPKIYLEFTIDGETWHISDIKPFNTIEEANLELIKIAEKNTNSQYRIKL